MTGKRSASSPGTMRSLAKDPRVPLRKQNVPKIEVEHVRVYELCEREARIWEF